MTRVVTEDQLAATDWDCISSAQRMVTIWASKQFPKRSANGVYLKLYGELYESIRDPSSPHELADVFILLLDLASMQNINLAKALAEKMEINAAREWLFDGATGLAQHIEGT